MENSELQTIQQTADPTGNVTRVENAPITVFAEPPETSETGTISEADATPVEDLEKSQKEKRELSFSELRDLATTWAQGYAQNMDPNSKAAMNVAAFPAYVGEELYNFGVDVTNAVSNLVGTGDLVEKSDIVEGFLPNDSISQFGREGAKFAIGYAQVLKGINATVGAAEKLPRITNAASGYISEVILNDPKNDTLLKSLLKNVPIADEVSDYLTMEDDTDGNLEKRLKNGLYGVIEGEIADVVFKALKHMKNSKWIAKKLQEETGGVGTGDGPPPVPGKDSGSSVGKRAEVDGTQPPEIPEDFKKNVKDRAGQDAPVTDEVFDEIIAENLVTGHDIKNVNTVNLPDGREINLMALDVDNDMRSFIGALIEKNPEYFAKVEVTDERLIKLAKDRSMTPKDLLQWEDELGLKRGTILAAEMVGLKATQTWVSHAKLYKAGQISRAQLTAELQTLRSMWRKITDMRSLSGSLLRESGVAAKIASNTEKLNYLDFMFSQDMDMIVNQALAKPTKLGDLRDALLDHTTDIGNSLVKIRISSMLSNPATHMRNIFGGLQNTALRVPESYVAATWNAITPGKDGVKFSDAHHEAIGMVEGIIDAFSVVKNTKNGAEFLGVRQKGSKLPSVLKQSTELPTSKLGKALFFLGDNPYIGKALTYGDNFIKHINARMTLRREAHSAGRELMKNKPNTTPEEYTAFIKDFMENPPFSAESAMYRDAEYVTMTNDVSGPILKSFESMSNTPLGRLVAPFARVNLNSISYKMERIPVLNLLLQKSRKELFGNVSPEVRQRAVAKLTTTSTLMTAVTYLLHSQDAIMGSAPTNRQKNKAFKDMGYHEGAIRVGDTWIEIRKETPVGAILNFTANMAQLLDALPEDQEYVYKDIMSAFMAISSEIINPDYFTDSFTELAEAIRSEDADQARRIMNYMGRQGTTFLPYTSFAREFTRQFNVTSEGEGSLQSDKSDNYNPADIFDSIWNNIKEIYAPALNTTKRNILGKPIQHKVGMGIGLVSPLGIFPDNSSPVMKELRRLSNVTKFTGDFSQAQATGEGSLVEVSQPARLFNMPSKYLAKPVRGQAAREGLRAGVRLSPEDYEKLVLETANLKYRVTEDGVEVDYKSDRGNDGRPTLEVALSRIINMAGYQNLDDALKFKRLKAVYDSYKSRAAIVLLNRLEQVSSRK